MLIRKATIHDVESIHKLITFYAKEGQLLIRTVDSIYQDILSFNMGGAIAPGISISTEALYTRAAKLPRIEIARPDNVVGKNTITAMQAGIVYGFVGQVEGIVNRIKAQSKEEPTEKTLATSQNVELFC